VAAGTVPLECSFIHASQSGHQLPDFSSAFSNQLFGIRYELIVQPMAALIAGGWIDDARNMTTRGEDKAGIAADQIL